MTSIPLALLAAAQRTVTCEVAFSTDGERKRATFTEANKFIE